LLTPFSAVLKKPTIFSAWNSNYEAFLPYKMKLERNSVKTQEAALKVKEFYFRDKAVSRETLQPLFNVSNINVYILHTVKIIISNNSIRHVLSSFFKFLGLE
jgi:hypothetical protein